MICVTELIICLIGLIPVPLSLLTDSKISISSTVSQSEIGLLTGLQSFDALQPASSNNAIELFYQFKEMPQLSRVVLVVKQNPTGRTSHVIKVFE